MSKRPDPILILRPTGLTAITFTTKDIGVGAIGYYIPYDQIILNEQDRLEMLYSDEPNSASFVASVGRRVAVELNRIKIWGSSEVQAIQRAEALRRAVFNPRGGTLEYRPDGITARSTFYHYLATRTPDLNQSRFGSWEVDQDASGAYFIIDINVRLETLPFATSDPANLIALTPTDRSTIDNSRSGVNFNYFTIDGDDIKGGLPAIARLQFQNQQAATAAEIERLFLTSRSARLSTLANLAQVYEAESLTIVDNAGSWSTVARTASSNGNYRKLQPALALNNKIHRVRFTLSNPADHQGQILFMAMCQTPPVNTTTWQCALRYLGSNNEIVATAEREFIRTQGAWAMASLGQLKLPPTETNALEVLAPVIELEFIRRNGQADIYLNLDFVALMFEDEAIAQFDFSPAIDETVKFLSDGRASNRGLAHVINASDDKLRALAKRHLGSSFIGLEPGFDTRIMAFFERWHGRELFYDDFDSYEGTNWIPVITFNAGENTFPSNYAITYDLDQPGLGDWVQSGNSQVAFSSPREGDDAIHRGTDLPNTESTSFQADLGISPETVELDLSSYRFVIALAYILDSTYLSAAQLSLVYAGGSDHYNLDTSSLGWRAHICDLTSPSSTTGAPDHSKFQGILYSFTAAQDILVASQVGMRFDYIRAEANLGGNPNPTGGVWDFNLDNGTWGITKDGPTADKGMLANFLNTFAGGAPVAVVNAITASDCWGYTAMLRTKENSEGGVVMRAAANFSTYYQFLIRSGGQLILYNAAFTVLASTGRNDIPVADLFWVGFRLIGSDISIYLSLTKPAGLTPADRLRNLCSVTNRILHTTDSSYASGKFGVASVGLVADVRFDEFYLEELNDGNYDDDDQLTVEAEALFRTIYPFSD